VTEIIDSLADVSDRYDALFCDLWGCVHDGVRAFPEAVDALRAFKARAVTVVMVTNAPRPRSSVARQLERLGVPDDCWDAIATSGDAARLAMFEGVVGTKVWHVGEPHDAPFFEPPAILDDPIRIEKVELDDAEGIVCTGPFRPACRPVGDAAAVPAGENQGPAACYARTPTSSSTGVTAGNGAPARWLSSIPRWAVKASISASRTRRSMTSRGRAWTRSAAMFRMTASLPWATGSSPTSRVAWARISTRSSSPAALRARKPERGRGPDIRKLAAFLDKASLEPSFAISMLR
jgi:hypothetical protein